MNEPMDKSWVTPLNDEDREYFAYFRTVCKRYNIDNSQRALHGALLDAAILADVYLAMTRQQGSMFGQDTLNSTAQQQGGTRRTLSRSPMPLPVLRASAEESAAHIQYLAMLDKKSGGPCVWRQLEELEPTENAPA